jgi:hypothetical protein
MAQGTAVQTSITGDPPPDDIDIPQDDAPDPAEAAVEARAREMGWKPLAEYRGPPGRWQPAADFIERGENILPIVRDQNRRLQERVGKLESEISCLRVTAQEQLDALKEMREMGRNADKRGYDRAMQEIKTKQRAAVAAGDTTAYDQLVEQAEALQDSRPVIRPPTAAPPEPSRPPTAAPPALSATTRAFIAENPWFNTNKLLADTMVAMHQEVLNERQATQESLSADPALDRELLEEAKQRVVERYPERFGVTPREPVPAPARTARRAASVAQPTPSPAAPASAAAATINSIQDPADRAQAREAYNRMKRQLPDYTEAEYMALYADPHSDVLAMQQKPRSQPNGR